MISENSSMVKRIILEKKLLVQRSIFSNYCSLQNDPKKTFLKFIKLELYHFHQCLWTNLFSCYLETFGNPFKSFLSSTLLEFQNVNYSKKLTKQSITNPSLSPTDPPQEVLFTVFKFISQSINSRVCATNYWFDSIFP